MEPEELINQFNQESGNAQEQLLETVEKLEEQLDRDIPAEETVEQLNNDYKEASRARARFLTETDDFTPTKPVKPLKQPKRNDYDGKRGLDAHEPDLLEHKQLLDERKEEIMTRAEEAYQRYREESHLEPVEPVINIPGQLEKLEELKEEKEDEISALRNYLHNLKKVKKGETQPQNTDYSIPEDEELIEDQIERASEQIYLHWYEISEKEDELKNYFQQMKNENNEAIEIAVKYGIRPVDDSIRGRERMLKDIDRYWTKLGGSVSRELPEKYSQQMT